METQEVSKKYDYAESASQVKSALRKAFGENATLVTNEGYNGRIHLKVVSERFNGMNGSERQQYVWDAIQDELDTKMREAISLVLCYSTDEL